MRAPNAAAGPLPTARRPPPSKAERFWLRCWPRRRQGRQLEESLGPPRRGADRRCDLRIAALQPARWAGG